MNEIEKYIRAAAIKRGMNPDAIIRAVNTEGGTSSWNRQSDVVKDGVRERSFGPFQLYMGGGLGNDFQKATGLDPSLAANGPAGADFALDYLAETGSWGPWYGPQNAGLPLDYGLKGSRPIGLSLNSNPINNRGYASEGPMQQAHERVVKPLTGPTQVADHPVAGTRGMTTDPGSMGDLSGLLAGLKTATGGGEGAGFEALMGAFGGEGSSSSSAPQIQPSNLAAASAAEDTTRISSAQQLMAALLNKRRSRVPGISLMG